MSWLVLGEDERTYYGVGDTLAEADEIAQRAEQESVRPVLRELANDRRWQRSGHILLALWSRPADEVKVITCPACRGQSLWRRMEPDRTSIGCEWCDRSFTWAEYATGSLVQTVAALSELAVAELSESAVEVHS